MLTPERFAALTESTVTLIDACNGADDITPSEVIALAVEETTEMAYVASDENDAEDALKACVALSKMTDTLLKALSAVISAHTQATIVVDKASAAERTP